MAKKIKTGTPSLPKKPTKHIPAGANTPRPGPRR